MDWPKKVAAGMQLDPTVDPGAAQGLFAGFALVIAKLRLSGISADPS
jgi:hypothetical protein